MKQIHIYRLLKFADHLANIKSHPEHGLIDEVELVTLAEKTRIHYKIRYQHWVLSELPAVFSDWYYHPQSGNALLEGEAPEYGTVGCFALFFSLNEEQVGHLIDIDACQLCERFGGVKLTEDSDGPDFARNIVELVKACRNEED